MANIDDFYCQASLKDFSFLFLFFFLCSGDNCLLFSQSTGPRRLKFCMHFTNLTRSELTKFGPDPPGQPGENPGFLFRAAKIKLRF